MKAKIIKGIEGGKITVPSSKSYVHRLLIANALSKTPAEITFKGLSEDIKATLNCVQNLNTRSTFEQASAKFTSNIPALSGKKVMVCQESGSTLRLLLPICAALGGEYIFNMKEVLGKRPLEPLISELIDKGCEVSWESNTELKLSGKLNSGIFSIPGNISSQYISGLLMALPLINHDSQIILTSKLQSKAYVNMTLDVLAKSGIDVKKTDRGFSVKGSQTYQLHANKVVAEGDWSLGAVWFGAGGFCQKKVILEGLNPNSLQGDKAIKNLIEENPLSNILDGSEIPDLVPILSGIMALTEGRRIITNCSRLRFKESDRISSTIKTITDLGGKAFSKDDCIIIDGLPKLRGGTVDSHNDHRIVMLATLLAQKTENPVIIENAEAINKSYPDFFEDFKKLGGIVEFI